MTDVAAEASGSKIEDTSKLNEITRNLNSLHIQDKKRDETEQVDTPMSNVSPISSDSELKMSRWLQIKDSLEGIPQLPKNEGGDNKMEANEHAPVYVKESRNRGKQSDSEYIPCTKPTSHINFSKIFLWDPWNKIGRRNKKEKSRKKREERHPIDHRNRSIDPSPILRKRTLTEEDDYLHRYCNQKENESGEKYHNKSVRFQKDVNVVYFAGDQVLDQTMEPLKKETEQQERNKELRKELCAETITGMKFVLRKSQSDSTPCWSKK